MGVNHFNFENRKFSETIKSGVVPMSGEADGRQDRGYNSTRDGKSGKRGAYEHWVGGLWCGVKDDTSDLAGCAKGEYGRIFVEK